MEDINWPFEPFEDNDNLDEEEQEGQLADYWADAEQPGWWLAGAVARRCEEAGLIQKSDQFDWAWHQEFDHEIEAAMQAAATAEASGDGHDGGNGADGSAAEGTVGDGGSAGTDGSAGEGGTAGATGPDFGGTFGGNFGSGPGS